MLYGFRRLSARRIGCRPSGTISVLKRQRTPTIARSSASVCGCGRSSKTASSCGQIAGGTVGRITSAAVTPAILRALLANVTGRVVVDKTGLNGWFRVDLEWSPEQTAADKPSVFTAVQEQLGLKLESTRELVDVLVIDTVDRLTSD